MGCCVDDKTLKPVSPSRFRKPSRPRPGQPRAMPNMGPFGPLRLRGNAENTFGPNSQMCFWALAAFEGIPKNTFGPNAQMCFCVFGPLRPSGKCRKTHLAPKHVVRLLSCCAFPFSELHLFQLWSRPNCAENECFPFRSFGNSATCMFSILAQTVNIRFPFGAKQKKRAVRFGREPAQKNYVDLHGCFLF